MFAASCDDDVFFAVFDADVAFIIDFGNVTGLKPTVLVENLTRSFRVFVIAANNPCTAHQ